MDIGVLNDRVAINQMAQTKNYNKCSKRLIACYTVQTVSLRQRSE